MAMRRGREEGERRSERRSVSSRRDGREVPVSRSPSRSVSRLARSVDGGDDPTTVLRRTVSRLSGDIAGLTSQMSQLMGLVQFQQAQLTELAGRPPTVVQQPVFTDYGIPRSPSPTRTVQGSPQVRQPFDSPPTASGFVDMATGSSNQNQDPSSRFDAGASFPERPGPPQQGSGPQPSATVTGSQASPAAMIVLPDGTQIPLGPVSPATSPTGAAANTGSIFGQNSQLDAFQKSDKWLPEMPKLDGSKWRTRVDEILGFESFIDRLMSWIGLASDSFASEIKAAIERTTPIENSHLSQQQASRGVRLLNILKQSFHSVPKAQIMISAYMESAVGFQVNGFELIRLLSREYGVRTRSEALHFKNQLTSKTFSHLQSVTEVIKSLEFEWSRYMKLLTMLDPSISRDGLHLLDSDFSMILLRSIQPEVRSYILMHSSSESFSDLQQAALKFESTQRMWSELSGNTSSLNAVVPPKGGKDGKGKGKDKNGKDKSKSKDGKGKSKDKSNNKTGKGKGQGDGPKTDGDNKAIVCFKCNGTGHYARECPTKGAKDSGGDSGSKSSDKISKGKQNSGKPSGGKSKGSGKGVRELVGEQPEQEQEEGSGTPLVSCILSAPGMGGQAESFHFDAMRFCILENFQTSSVKGFEETCFEMKESCFCRFDPMSSKFATLPTSDPCFSDGFPILMPIQPRSEPADPISHSSTVATDLKHDSPLQQPVLSGIGYSQDVDYWLVDSGASASVVSEQSLQHLNVISEDVVNSHTSDDFTTATGESLPMLKCVVIEIWVQARQTSSSRIVALPCQVSCLVAKVLQHNVLSLGSLLNSGWNIRNSGKDLILCQEQFELNLISWQNCPWIRQLRGELSPDAVGFVDEWVDKPMHFAIQRIPEDVTRFLSTDGAFIFQPSVKRKADDDSLLEEENLESKGSQEVFHGETLHDDPDEPNIPGFLTEDGVGKSGPLADAEVLDKSAQHPTVRAKKSMSDLAKHRMHGHTPFHSECVVCKQSKSVKQHRRKTDKGIPVTEIYADFFFWGLSEADSQKYKMLCLVDAATGMLGVIPMGPDPRQISSWLMHWLSEFNQIGISAAEFPLEIYTDKEQSVGKLFRQSMIGRTVALKRAAPQAHEAVGQAEKGIRRLKESVAAIRLDLRENLCDICDTQKAVACIFCYAAFCHNLHSAHGDGKLSPAELAVGKKLPEVQTGLFGTVVLAEVPESLRKYSVSRFMKSMYIRPEFSSLGHVVVGILSGEQHIFVAKSIKLIYPLEFEPRHGPEFLHECDPFELKDVSTLKKVSKPKPSEPFRVVDGRCDLNSIRNTPTEFIREHGKTAGCRTCERDSFHGSTHSAACVRRYKQFLQDMWRAEDLEKSGNGGVRDKDDVPRRLLSKQPRPENLPEPSVLPPNLAFEKMEELIPPPMPADSDMHGQLDKESGVFGDGLYSSTEVGDEMDVEVEPHVLDSHDDVMDTNMVNLVTEFDPYQTVSIQHRIFAMVDAIFYKKDKSTSQEEISLCGEGLLLYRPHYAISDTTGEWLDVDLVMAGIRTEVANMTEQCVGRVCRESEAVGICKEHAIKPITTRWVVTLKEPLLVRSRLVARELKRGGPQAKDIGISSPTSSVESLRATLSEAAYHDWSILGLDVSAAFMAAPLLSRTILKLPGSFSYQDGEAAYLDAARALNGLRASGAARTNHLKIISESSGMHAGSIETTIFSGNFRGKGHVVVISYVDDLLIFSQRMETCEEVFQMYAKKLTIKETGRIYDSTKGGKLRFLGRNIHRAKGDRKIMVFVDEDYMDSCFEMYGLQKGTEVPPDLRPILDDISTAACEEVSPDAATKYKSCLGKLSWLCQTRSDLLIYSMLLATGMAKPLVRHEKCMRSVLRWLITQRRVQQVFPTQNPILDIENIGSSLVGFCDASWAPLLCLKRRSITGAFIFFRGSLIKAFSRLQVIVALSSCESEVCAIAEIGVEIEGIRKMVEHLVGDAIDTSIIYTDNQASVRVAYNSGLSRKSRHFEIRVFWIQRQLMDNIFQLLWCPGDQQIADLATKTLGRRLFEKFQAHAGFMHYGPRSSEGSSQPKSKAKSVNSVSAKTDDSVLRVGNLKAFVSRKDTYQSIFRCDELPKAAICDFSDFSVVFVEICCAEDSTLASEIAEAVPEALVIRVTKEASIQKYSQQLSSFVQAMKRKGCQIVAHLSAPCTGGSNLLNLSDNRDELKEKHRVIFYEILEASFPTLKQVDAFSFELPMRCNYWKEESLHDFQKRLSHHLQTPILGTLVKLCALKVYVLDGLPVGKSFLFVSTSHHIVGELFPFHICDHERHAGLSQVRWKRTECYPRALCQAYAKGLQKFINKSSLVSCKGFTLFHPEWNEQQFLYNPHKFRNFPF